MSPTSSGPRHIFRWATEVARHLAEGSLGGEVYALGEMAGRIPALEDFYWPFEGANPALVGLDDCESLSTRLETEQMIAEKNMVRHF